MATGGSDKDAQGRAPDDDAEEAGKLMCAICLERFRRPKLLPCFHTFCQSCLQGLAGASPSMTCPSCRTFLVLPPGGVRALQTNFYIEEDLADPASPPQQRLCDVCSEDREATHVCFQCRQRLCSPCRTVHDGLKGCQGHTMMSLTQEGCEKGGARFEEGPKEEVCPKHPNQPLLLRCKQCQGDICIQCKLTHHEGHPTEDLADARSKARTTLELLLENMAQQRQHIHHLVLALKDRRVHLQNQTRETEQSFQDRADTLLQWVNQSLDESVANLQKSAQDVEKGLQDQVELLEKKDGALQAQQDYVMRVLNEGSGADLVPLEAQLSSSRSEGAYLKRVEKELSQSLAPFQVQQVSSGLGQMQVREFVGVLKPVLPTSFPLQDSDPVCSGKSPTADSSADKPGNQEKGKGTLEYSKNPASLVVAMCPISRSRLWVAYKPASTAAQVLKLFDADGKVLVTVNNVKDCHGLVPISDDTVLAWVGWCKIVNTISSEGKVSQYDLGSIILCLILSEDNKLYMAVMSTVAYTCSNTFRVVQFSKTDKLTFSETGAWHFSVPNSLEQYCVSCRHVSGNGEYVAAIVNDQVQVYSTSALGSSTLYSIYNPGNKLKPLDVRFCSSDQQQVLFVVVEGFRSIHVVDHTDGCRLLATHEIPNLKVKLLTTYFDQNFWIGCDGGQVMYDK